MNCEIIKDLIPLYIDDCCSSDSATAVKEHIRKCSECKELFDSMNTPKMVPETHSVPAVMSRLNDFKASVVQTILLFVSFVMITAGVAMEAATPLGIANGCWALALIVPATGFMLSLTNWYFVRLYKSRRSFSGASLFATLGAICGGYVWAFSHYGFAFYESNMIFYAAGALLTVMFCVLSKVLSCKYAKMLCKF